MSLPRSIASALLVVFLAACADDPSGAGSAQSTDAPVAAAADAHAPADWPIFRGDPQLTGVAGGMITSTPTLLWTYQTGAAIASSPVIARGRVYVGSDDGSLHAVELATGTKVWSFATEDIVEAPPLVVDGGVFFGSSDFHFYALDAETGALRWKRETDDKILGGASWIEAPDGQGIRIVVGCYDNRLYCLDAGDGAVIWTYETENYVNGTPAIAGDAVVFGGCDAVLHVVDAATGAPRAKVELGPECHVAGSVAVYDGHVYFGHYGNAFVSVDLERAELAWSYVNPRFAFFSSPSVTDELVVFGGRDKYLHCANRADGSPLWTFPTRRKVDGSPVVCGDKVVFGSGDGQIYLLNLADGRELWTYDIGQSIFSSPAVAGGTIVIGSNDGRLYAFGSSRGSS